MRGAPLSPDSPDRLVFGQPRAPIYAKACGHSRDVRGFRTGEPVVQGGLKKAGHGSIGFERRAMGAGGAAFAGQAAMRFT